MNKIICCLFVALPCHAEIYHCIRADGQNEFRDTPCSINSIPHQILTVETKSSTNVLLTMDAKIDKNTVNSSPVLKLIEKQKTIQKAAREEQKRLILAEKAQRKASRLKKRAEKKAIEAQQKKEQQIIKQQKLAEKIQKIENQLRLGTKLKNPKKVQHLLEKTKNKQVSTMEKTCPDHP